VEETFVRISILAGSHSLTHRQRIVCVGELSVSPLAWLSLHSLNRHVVKCAPDSSLLFYLQLFFCPAFTAFRHASQPATASQQERDRGGSRRDRQGVGRSWVHLLPRPECEAASHSGSFETSAEELIARRRTKGRTKTPTSLTAGTLIEWMTTWPLRSELHVSIAAASSIAFFGNPQRLICDRFGQGCRTSKARSFFFARLVRLFVVSPSALAL